jgi:hypothetical protein
LKRQNKYIEGEREEGILERQNKYIKEEREAGIVERQMCSSQTDVYCVFSPSFRIS